MEVHCYPRSNTIIRELNSLAVLKGEYCLGKYEKMAPVQTFLPIAIVIYSNNYNAGLFSPESFNVGKNVYPDRFR